MTHGLHQIHPSYPLFAPPSLIVKVHYMLQISLPTNTRTFPTYLLISRLISLIKFAAFTYPNFLSPMINCPGPLPTIASLPLNPPTLPYYNRTQTPLSHGSGSCIFLQKLRISYGYVVMKVYPQKLICISLALPQIICAKSVTRRSPSNISFFNVPMPNSFGHNLIFYMS